MRKGKWKKFDLNKDSSVGKECESESKCEKMKLKKVRKRKWNKFDLNKDSSVGKECEENNANHGETPNLQSGESCKKET